MARYVHIAVGALLLSLAGASAYELCQENPLLQQTSVYQLR
jgi:heme exporter protein D